MTRQIHTVPVAEVHALLRTRSGGLSARESGARLAELGPNRLQATRQFSTWRTLLGHFTNFFSLLLDAAAVLCFVADHVEPDAGMKVLGIALALVSIMNALFAFFQEVRAERAMQELEKFLPERVTLRRDGRDLEAMAESLVPGDVVLVSEGNRVPADARVVESEGLLINNAALSGESHPVLVDERPAAGRLIDSKNVIFAGTSVLAGSATAVVFATGARTEFGRIAGMSAEIKRPKTPLERQTSSMVRTLTLIAVSMGAVFFAYGVAAGRSVWVNLVFMLGIIVANVPEGLLPTFTLALAVGARRLAKKNVLVKSLSAVESLGSVQVICTDKTGTLTLNQLAVRHVVEPIDGDELGGEALEELLDMALVASDLKRKNGAPFGDPLDLAIARRGFPDPSQLPAPDVSLTQHFPFDVQKRRSAGLRRTSDGKATFAVKGAWENLRPSVTRHAAGPLDPDQLSRADQVVEKLARRGQRVIAVAARRCPEGSQAASQDELERDLSLLGFIALEDPLRSEVPDAVRDCKRAGIVVVLITGDHPETAKAIAHQAGILDAKAHGVLTGVELENTSLSDLARTFDAGTRVFARTTPEQKMKIVTALKQRGLVVAMTGDGVNDAPALKAADVGVAMGLRGTDVAREAAQIVLLDDNFASIVRGIEEGRAIYDNIRKFTNYVLVSNGPEIVPFLLYVLFPVPLALTVIQILVIDLGTDVIPSMALGQEPADPAVMREPPRSSDARLLSGSLIAHSYGFLGLLEAAYSLSLFFLVLWQGGWQWGQELDASSPLYRSATGICLSSIVLMQIGNFIGRRSRTGSGLDRSLLKNRLTLLGFALEIAFSYAVLYVPSVTEVLQTGPVSPATYALAALGAPFIFGADLLRKRWVAHHRPAPLAPTCSA